MKCLRREKKILINYQIKVDETVRWSYRTVDNERACEKEVFRIDGSYFLHTYQRNVRVFMASLREISAEEFSVYKEELLSHLPRELSDGICIWEEDGMEHQLVNYFKYKWKCVMASEDCMFSTKNIISIICDKVVAAERKRRAAEQEQIKQGRYDYARQCGILNREMGIEFVNVLKIGPDREKLTAFQTAYEKSLKKVLRKSIRRMREIYHAIAHGGPKACGETLKQLGIPYFEAVPSELDLHRLEEVLLVRLRQHIDGVYKNVRMRALALDAEKRNELLEKLYMLPRLIQKHALADLGMKWDGVDYKMFPFQELKRELIKSLPLKLRKRFISEDGEIISDEEFRALYLPQPSET